MDGTLFLLFLVEDGPGATRQAGVSLPVDPAGSYWTATHWPMAHLAHFQTQVGGVDSGVLIINRPVLRASPFRDKAVP